MTEPTDEQLYALARKNIDWSQADGEIEFARAVLALSASPAPIDVEQMLRATVPGGSSCDPQHIADAIRGWFADRGSPAPAEPVQQETKGKINYTVLWEYAGGRGLSYNELCQVVHAALVIKLATPHPVQPEEAVARDAARYRHMRDLSVEQTGMPGQPCIALPNGMQSGYYLTEEAADHAVDTSIEQAAQQNGGGES